MKIYLLDSGSLVIDHSQVMWNINCGTPVRFPVYSVLIEHPEGLFLFDTGYDFDHVKKVLPFELPEQTEQQTIPEQLKLCGFTPEDVDFVINSHLHFDHVGGNKHLRKATTILHKQELRQGKVPEPFERLGYSDQGFDHDDVTYELVEGDVEVAKGLQLIFTPGHTVGHYSLLIETSGRKPMFFIADVSYTPEAYEKNMIAGFHNDPTTAVNSIKRVKRAAKEYDAEVFFSHGMEAFKGYKLAPEFYEG
jgi:4-pyridoxolactonase